MTTKKEAVFALFKEGKNALSLEVKDFRLRSKRGTLPPRKLKGIVRKLSRRKRKLKGRKVNLNGEYG